MAGTDVSAMEGMFKEVYGDGPVRAVPQAHHLANDIKFVAQEQREGAAYNVPVLLTREHGHSFAVGGTLFDLAGAVTDQSKNARVTGAEHVLQVQLSYGALQKATSKGPRAFANATKYKVKSAVESSSYIREYQLLYGSGATPATGTLLVDNMGELGGITTVGAGVETITITSLSWSQGLWAGAVGMNLDCYDNAGTLLNTNAAIVVSAVNDARTISVTGNVTDLAALGAGDFLYPRGSYGKTMIGACRVASTVSGDLHGISATTYDLWRGNTKPIGGALTFTTLLEALLPAVNKGFSGKMIAYVSPNQWQDINDDQGALRRYTGNASGGKVSNGATSLSFYSQSGEIEIKPHIFMKQGFALALAAGECVRTGATDITFKMPDHGKIFRHLDTKAGVEFRTYQNQTFFTPAPAHAVLLTGITSSGDV